MNTSQDNSKVAVKNTKLLRHLAAILYDALLLIAALILIAGVWVTTVPNEAVAKHGAQALYFLIPLAFFHYFWSKGGQTLGMQAWRLKLVTKDGKPLSFKHSFLRYIGAYISLAILGLGYIWMLFDKEKLTWHDRISNTHLLLLPKRKK